MQFRDRLVAGLNLPDLERKILAEDKVTFEMVKEFMEAYDNIQSAVANKQIMLVGKRTNVGKSRDYKRNKEPVFSKKISNPTCYSCGGQHLRNGCKFREAKCFK